MLSDDSILRRIPLTTEPKQALFFDGIRHSIEMIDLAYSRLRENLTNIALNELTPKTLIQSSPAVFLDAWAIVDAIDRFRMLYTQMPGMTHVSASPSIESLKDVTEQVRKLRNVADHLSQRADYVVSQGGAALGTLTWLTGFKVDPPTLWYCTLRPGTIRIKPEFRKDPILTTIDWPTDQIYLSAGGYEANLSEVLPHIEIRVKHLEGQLENAFKSNGLSEHPVASDVFLRQAYQIAPNQHKGRNN